MLAAVQIIRDLEMDSKRAVRFPPITVASMHAPTDGEQQGYQGIGSQCIHAESGTNRVFS